MLNDLDKASELRGHAKKVASQAAKDAFTRAADRLEARAARKAGKVGVRPRRKRGRPAVDTRFTMGGLH